MKFTNIGKKSKEDGNNKIKDLILIPELCQFCVYRAKNENPESDWLFDHCEWLEGDFKPSMLCFIPKHIEKYTQINEVFVKYTQNLPELLRELEKAYYKDIRNFYVHLAKIIRLSKTAKKKCIQALTNFLSFLDQNNLAFDTKFLVSI